MHVHSNTYGILYTLCEVLNEVPTIFTEKEGAGTSKTTVSVLRAKIFLYALRKLVS